MSDGDDPTQAWRPGEDNPVGADPAGADPAPTPPAGYYIPPTFPLY